MNSFLFLFAILFQISFLAEASRFAVVRGCFAGDGVAQLAAFTGGGKTRARWTVLVTAAAHEIVPNWSWPGGVDCDCPQVSTFFETVIV